MPATRRKRASIRRARRCWVATVRRVSTTEHLLSALFAMGVTNAEIHVRRARRFRLSTEAAADFVDGDSRVRPPDADRAARACCELDEPLFVAAGDRMIVGVPVAERFACASWRTSRRRSARSTSYGEIDPDGYREEIAGARTFAYLHEVEALWARGLARGGSLENALVFAPDGPMQPLRWPNEAVRHKVLDLIGDLALLGAWPQCEIVAIKSGHELHASLTRALRARLRVPSA